VDLGTAMTDGRVSSGEEGPMETVEQDGSTWSRARSRSVSVRFVLPDPTAAFVAARIDPIAAKSVTILVDDVKLGSARLKGDEPRVVETSPTELPLDAGEHTVQLRFGPTRSKDAHADVDWVRLAVPDASTVTFGAPTLDDVLDRGAVLAKVPHRAWSLRVPGTVRCPVRVPQGARLKVAVGMVGAGEAEAEVAARSDGAPAVSLSRTRLVGGDEARWQDVDIALDAFAGRVVHLELRAPAGTPSARVLFGDPEVVVAAPPATKSSPAQVVVVLVLSGVERDDLPGYAARAPQHLPRLRKHAERATVFRGHRAPAPFGPASVATLLTGLAPEQHTLTDQGARLPAGIATFVESAHQASIGTAMFTAVPQTFGAFGFARDRVRIETFSPVSGDGRDAIGEAARWIQTTLAASPEARLLVFVHARGGHPPWALDPKRLEGLPPENYTGDVTPRRAAQLIAAVRGRRRFFELPDADQVRLSALYQLAMAEQDRAFGDLVDALAEGNVEDKTLMVVTADVSSGLTRLFAEELPLDERALALPLYVTFPGGIHAARTVQEPTEVADVTQTVYGALGLSPPAAAQGRDLAAVAADGASPGGEPLVASAGDARSARWGSLIMVRTAKGSRLCDVDVDPTCAFDRRPLYPLTSFALDKALAEREGRVSRPARAREPATIDDETLAALRVWGSME
jgi:arylsulfatase A-like enzyme